ncbi:MAG: hypothetical protein WCQ53_00325 [bacterium]
MLVISKHRHMLVDVLMAAVCLLSAYLTIINNALNIQTLFKIYLLAALVFFISVHSQRYQKLEILNLVSFIIGAFFLLSFRSELIVFCSMTLMVASILGFTLTRIRPNKHTITAIGLLLVLILLHKVSPNVSTVMLLLISFLFCFISDNRSIESFIILFIFPILLYLSIDHLSVNGTKLFFPLLVRITGLTFIVISTLTIMSKRFKDKRMIAYATFYAGHFIFLAGIKTPEAMTLAVLFAFIMPFIYTSEPDLLSVFNLAMLPLSPAFILKIALIMMIMKIGMPVESAIVVICSLIVMILSISDLSNIMLKTVVRKTKFPAFLKGVSLAVLLLSIIYLDTVKNVVKITIKAING